MSKEYGVKMLILVINRIFAPGSGANTFMKKIRQAHVMRFKISDHSVVTATRF